MSIGQPTPHNPTLPPMTVPPVVPWLLLAIAVAASVTFAALFVYYRRRLYATKGKDHGHPIPTVRLEDFDPLFARDAYGPGMDAAVRFVGTGDGAWGATSDTEGWVLAVFARQARCMFEFGTATGRTAWLWAANSPADARVVTLTLPPDAATDRGEPPATGFRYTGTPGADKIDQRFGDSLAFEPGELEGRCDLIFIDGSHAYEHVRSDTEKALRMLAPGGAILWHDYRRDNHRLRGVYRYLNELARELPLVRLSHTSFVAYRSEE